MDTPEEIGGAELNEEHYKVLSEGSGISDPVIGGRGYRSLTISEVASLVAENRHHASILQGEGWLAIPVYRPDGTHHCNIIRLDHVRKGAKGSQKYLWPGGLRNALDVHPHARQYVADTNVPLIITEGIKKGDALYSRFVAADSPACVVSINGCWGWRAVDSGSAGSVACADFLDLGLGDRQVTLISDSDFLTNDNVRQGWDELARYLQSKECKVTIIVVPPKGMAKQGADDYLLDHTLDELLALARSPSQVESNGVGSFEVLSAQELLDATAEDVPFLIRNLIPEASIAVMAGHTESHKTWHAIVMLVDLALGRRWLGHPDLDIPHPVNTLYVNMEMGRPLMGDRLRKVMEGDEYNDPEVREKILAHLHFLDDASFDLAQEASRTKLINILQERDCKMAVFDSLSMCWGGDENSASEVGQLYQYLRYIVEQTGCSIMLIHHLTKPSKERSGLGAVFNVRGSGQIIQQADSALLLDVQDMDGPRKVIRVLHAKSRAVRHVDPFLTEVEDHNGFATSLVYKNTVAGEADENPNQPDKLTAWILTELPKHPAIFTEGMRFPLLKKLLTQAWPEENGREKPNDQKLRRCFKALIQDGILVRLEESRRYGDLFQLAPNLDPQES